MSSLKVDKKELEAMLAAACHFGHKVSKWNPKMRPYLYTKREGVHIFDLTKTYQCLMQALEFLKESAAMGKTILLVCTKLHATKLVTEAAQRSGCPFVTQKWMPGLLTNYETIRKRIKYFKDLKAQRESGEWEKYTKKERLELSRALEKLEDAFSGVEFMNHIPDVLVIFDAVRDQLVLREAKRLKIPTVGICDSNADPDLVSYPIPGNDDAVKSLTFFINKIGEALEEGKKLYALKGSAPQKAEASLPHAAAKVSPSLPETPVV